MVCKVNVCTNLSLLVFLLCCTGSTFRVDAINLGIYDFLFCRPECCNEDYISLNETGLVQELEKTLYGQHLVIDTVVASLREHFSTENPAKALVLSFHGSVGTGKNFVSNIIANNIYKQGMKSNYVRYFMAGYHFAHKQQSMVDIYKDQLKEWIRTNVSRCDRTMFIFDEMHMMPPGLIDIIKANLENFVQLDGIDYRKSIFLFLSNTGSTDIAKTTLEQWKQSMPREDLTLEDFEEDLVLGSYNKEIDGMWHSRLIQSNLINYFIPFLPLERQHVKKCIEAYMKSKNFTATESDVNAVADMLQYSPEGNQLFSKTGCKRVPEKANLVISERQKKTGKREAEKPVKNGKIKPVKQDL